MKQSNASREQSANDVHQVIRRGCVADIPPLPGWGDLLGEKNTSCAPTVASKRPIIKSASRVGYRKCKAQFCGTNLPIADMVKVGEGNYICPTCKAIRDKRKAAGERGMGRMKA